MQVLFTGIGEGCAYFYEGGHIIPSQGEGEMRGHTNRVGDRPNRVASGSLLAHQGKVKDPMGKK